MLERLLAQRGDWVVVADLVEGDEMLDPAVSDAARTLTMLAAERERRPD